ncbi:hypothetical protein KCP75_09420 [Salmonella enterica subsp. enterica]|nr:hypothetical protein KCP75_09420 [Salmonella enterica subsp. enterica]
MILRAALTSRRGQFRTCSTAYLRNIKRHFFMVKPQQLQRFEDGKNWSILPPTAPPIRLAYRSWRVVLSSRLLLL